MEIFPIRHPSNPSPNLGSYIAPEVMAGYCETKLNLKNVIKIE